MLQCNKSPGLDANEIIRLTSAIGQKRKFDASEKQPFERLLRSKTCHTAYANNRSERSLGCCAREADHLSAAAIGIVIPFKMPG